MPPACGLSAPNQIDIADRTIPIGRSYKDKVSEYFSINSTV